MRQQAAGRSPQRHAGLFLRTTKYSSVLLCTTKCTPYYKVLLQYYSVLQSTTPVLFCTTKYYSSTTLYYKVLLQYCSALQSATPVLLCTTKYYSSTTLYYKVLLQYSSVLQSTTPVLVCTTKCYSSTTLYYKVLLQYYSVLQSTTPVLVCTTKYQNVLRDRQFFNILTWKCASRHSGVQFLNIGTSKSGPKLTCFVHFHLPMCFSPQRRAIFGHLNFKKCSEPLSFFCILP